MPGSASTGNNVSSRGYYTRIDWSWSDDAANNRSYVSATFTAGAQQNYFAGWACAGNFVWNGSTVWNASGNYSFPGNYTEITLASYANWVGHDANGNGSFSTSGYFQMVNQSQSYSMPYTASSGSSTLTNYDRSPVTPTISSVVRSADGTQITTFNFSGGVNNSGPAVTYTYEYATDAGMSQNYGTFTSLPFTLPSATTGYYFRVRAVNTDGTKYSSVTSIRPGVPSAPASLSYVKTGRNVALTATASATNGGGTISSYSVQYRTSSDGGSTWGSWGNTQTMTSLGYTYSLLTPALTYDFRVYSTNETGNSLPTSIAAPFFVAAGGKRWNGTSFIPTQTAKRWSGTAWVDITIAKRWNGTSWVDLS